MRILVCGSRDWPDKAFVHARLYEYINESDLVIIEGDSRGADRMAGLWADKYGIKHEVYPADWKTHGRAAGFIRNKKMIDTHPDLVLAFQKEKSKGTQHTIDLAIKAGIPVRVFDETGRVTEHNMCGWCEGPCAGNHPDGESAPMPMLAL